MNVRRIPRPLVRVLIGVAAFYGTMAVVALVLRRTMRSIGDEISDEVALAAGANGIELKSRAAAFRGGTVRAAMGGIQLDLRAATLAAEGARLDVRAIMGGVEIILPESWPVRVSSAHAVMGGVEHPRSMGGVSEVDGPALELSLLAVMGGIEVTRKRSTAE